VTSPKAKLIVIKYDAAYITQLKTAKIKKVLLLVQHVAIMSMY